MGRPQPYGFATWTIAFAFGLLLVGMALAMAPGVAACGGGVLCVDADAPGPTHDGSTWTTAYTDLQTALTAASSGNEIWVAEGVYYPATSGGDRSATFSLKSGVALYGGFAATETLRTQRDWTAYETVLSGDTDRNDSQRPVITDTATVTNTDSNVYHIVTGATDATLDGFTITAGRTASCTTCGTLDRGGGMLNDTASPTLTHLVIRGNQAEAGAGMANVDGSNPVLDEVWVHDNAALLDPNGIGWGAGILNTESCLRISNSRVTNNRASAFGGGIGTDNRNYTTCLDGGGDTTFIVSNVEFSGNYAGSSGGGMYNYYASPAISNSEFTANSSEEGGGLGNSRSTATLTDVVIEDNLANSGSGRGGGMSNWIEADVTLRRVIIRNNRANSEGGAMWNYSSAPTLVDCIVSGNVAIGGTGSTGAYGDGGAFWGAKDISYSGDATLHMTNVVVSGNCASRDGGGISHWSDYGADLHNVTIVANRAGLRDGSPYKTGCLGEQISVVITGRGGGIASWFPTTLENSIVWGNWAQTSGTEQIDTGNGALTASYSIIQNGSSFGTEHILTSDPNLSAAIGWSSAPSSAGNYRLEPDSPAIDAGDNTNVTEATDLDGNPRLIDDIATTDTGLGTPPIVDMGAYEYGGSSPDLAAVKLNDTGGLVAAGHPFTWTIAVTNTGTQDADFDSGVVILQDDLPSSGATYGTPVVIATSAMGITPAGGIACSIASSTLRCTPTSGMTVTIGAEGGHFQVSIPVTPNAVTTLANPRSGGTCKADPNDVIAEAREGNNSCSDSVTAGGVTLVTAIHDAAHDEITSAPLGTPIHGRASFDLPAGSTTPTGYVFLRLYDNPSCSGTVLAADAKLLVDGVAESDAVPAQSFYYKVSYEGDATHSAAASACKLFSATQPGPTLTVNTTADDDFDDVCSDTHCTLREAIEAANSLDGANDIRFDVGTDKTITLAAELPAIRTGGGAVSIDGEDNLITVDGAGAYRMFWATDAARATLAHLTIVDGKGRSCEEYGLNTCGSGLKVDAGTVVTLTHSSILNSSAELGGGVTNYGTLTVLNSTLANNTSTGTTAVGGGAIYNQNGVITLQNSTVSGNQAPQGGAVEQRSGGFLSIVNSTIVSNTATNASTSGLSLICGVAILRNSIVANNDGTNNFSVDAGSFTSQGYNLSNAWNGVSTLASDLTADPELGALADNGGDTWTHAPLTSDAPGVDAGDPGFWLPTDQRDERRPRGAAGDIGSVERQPTSLSIAKSVVPTADVAYHGPVTYTIVVANTDIVPEAGLTVTDVLPGEVTFGYWTQQPGGAAYSGGTLTWAGTLQAQSAVTLSFVANSIADYLETITNTAHLADRASELDEDDAAFTVTCPSTVTVTSLNDSGAGSLRQAIADVCTGGNIYFAPALSGGTIVLTTTQLEINKSVTIAGPGEGALSVSGDDARRVFSVGSGVVAELRDLTITHGKSNVGGGLLNYGTLTLERVAVTNSQADTGGGILNTQVLTLDSATVSHNRATTAAGIYTANSVGGNLAVRNSTLSDNQASIYGSSGGIYLAEGVLTIWNSTLSGNSSGFGGALVTGGGPTSSATIVNSTIAGNSAPSDESAGLHNLGITVIISNTVIADSLTGDDCRSDGTIAVNTNNLIEDGTCGAPLSGDPLLAPLADYGGGTATYALLPGSPLIDAGGNCPATDQRGVGRPQGGGCDIGAFESRGFALTYGGGSDQRGFLNTAFGQPLAVGVTSAYSEPVSAGLVTFTGPAVGASTAPTITMATVADEGVSPTVTANDIEGSYTVTATARGALDVSIPFTLTNVYAGISLRGAGLIIPMSDAIPSSADGTDFGALLVPDGAVTHTFSMENGGESALSVSDITFTGPAASDFSAAGIVTPTTLNADGSDSFQIVFDPSIGGTRVATATVVSDDTERGSYDFALQGDGIAADLELVKTVSAALVGPGDPLTYTVVFTNQGPDPAPGVMLIDHIPDELYDAAVSSSGVTITNTGITPLYTWQVSDLAPGNGGIVTISGVLSRTLRGGYTFTNTAAVACSLDPQTANNSGRAVVTVLNVAPDAVDDSYAVTEDSVLTVPAAGVLENDSDRNGDPLSAVILGTAAHGTLDLASDGGFVYTPTADFNGIDTFTYQADDGQLLSNVATVTVTVEALADLQVQKTATPETAVPGETITYTVVARNAGPSDASSVMLLDFLPDAIADAVWTCASHVVACPVVSGSGSLSMTLDLPAGGVLTYTIVGVIDPAEEEMLSNTAVLTAPTGPVDPQPANNAAGVATPLTPEVDLGVAKTHVLGGGWITYTLVVSNTGPSDAPGVVVSDSIPAGLDGFAWSCETGGGATAGGSGSGAIYDTTSLPAHSVVTYTVNSHMLRSSGITNRAELLVPSGITDTNTGNNSARDAEGGMVYLPLVSKNYTLMPDLIVTGIKASTDRVLVEIENVGTSATVNDFWVDLYFNPIDSPPRINQQWQAIAPAGIAWGVTRSLAPGESLELVSGGDYYWPTQSTAAPYPADATVWALVDSVNYATTYGAVRESNEENNTRSGRSTAAGDVSVHTQGKGMELGNLPPRR